MKGLEDYIKNDDFCIKADGDGLIVNYGRVPGQPDLWNITRYVDASAVHRWLLEEADIKERYEYGVVIDEIVAKSREAA